MAKGFRYYASRYFTPLLVLACLGVFCWRIVEADKARTLDEGAFASWLAENDRYRFFNNLKDAREAYRFVRVVTKQNVERERSEREYRDFLKKWKIPKKPEKDV